MNIKLFYKDGDTKVIDTNKIYTRSKKSIEESSCGSLIRFEKYFFEYLKTKTDIVKFEILGRIN